ncbi:HTH domain-containing protein [Listeria valentina]|uniref:HTH domain-containing protein n=1 Tax=Listeria valentina TaxID=2705293 RepID=UPI001431BDC9|nr:HTH domain-containing protein [Listeria valentina]
MRMLDTRFYLFLKQLVEQKEFQSISSLARMLGFSRRTIYHYLEKGNYLLKQEGIEPLESVSGKLSLSAKQAAAIENWLKQASETKYLLKAEERRQLILALLLVENRKWQLSSLQVVLDVSRNTILKDIQILKSQLVKQGLEVKSTKARGYFISTLEIKRRELLYDFVYRIEMERNDPLYATLLELLLGDATRNEQEFLAKARCAVETAEEILSKKLSEQDLRILIKAMQLYQIRVNSSQPFYWEAIDRALIHERLEFTAAKALLDGVPELSRPEEYQVEQEYYGALLLCLDKNEDAHFQSVPFGELLQISERIIRLFEKMIGLYIKQKEELTEHIQTYIKVLFYRHQFQMELPAYSLDTVSEQFQKVFGLTKKVMQLMEQDILYKRYFSAAFKNEELAHLAVFFEEAIVKEQTDVSISKVLIVSDYSDVLNSLLKTQVKQLLPEVMLVGAFSSEDARYFPEKVNFCIATDPSYFHFTGQTIHVPVILTESAKKKILQGYKNGEAKPRKRVQLKQILKQQAGLEEVSERLLNQIESLYGEISEETVVKHSETTKLETFLADSEFAQTETKASSITEVIRTLKEPLLERKFAQESYFERLLMEMEAHRTALIYPKVMLILTDYRFGSFRAGVSLLYLKESVVFTENEEVTLFVLITTEERMTHVPLLFELDHLLQNGFLDALKSGYTMFESFLLGEKGVAKSENIE